MPLVSLILGGVNFWIFGVFFLGFLEKRQYFKSSRSRLGLHAKKMYRNINSTLVYGVFYRSNNPEARRDWPLLIHDGCND